MTNSKELFQDLVRSITIQEDKGEIQSLVYLLLEKFLKLSKTDILSEKEITVNNPDQLRSCVERINQHEPIQYILGEAEFYGRIFQVNPSVLIPRPETELLVYEVIQHAKAQKRKLEMLDIGSGSGCKVKAIDISADALACAKLNASELNAHVEFSICDILIDSIEGEFDIIVSNPPYIALEEKAGMERNVLEHEPHLALFAPEHEPLAFYKAIALKSKHALLPKGSVWVEINQRFGNEVKNIFESLGYRNCKIIKDLDNKDRIITAQI
jgi:release factor glutamine methyltransferase